MLRVRGHLYANDVLFLLQAARRGRGIAMLPRVIYEGALEAGEVVEVLADSLGINHHIALVYVDREFLKPAVRAFIDFTVDWLERHGDTIAGLRS